MFVVLGSRFADFFIFLSAQFFNYEDANPGQDSAGADEDLNDKPAESDLENGRRRSD